MATNPKDPNDVTKAWAANQGQKSSASHMRIFAWIFWIIAIGGEIYGIYLLRQHKFDTGGTGLLIGLLCGIGIAAMIANVLWKSANRQDPASRADGTRFFIQNQLGAIMTVLAFLPLIIMIFMDKDMDPKNKQIAGGAGVVIAILAAVMGVDFKPASVEQYTQDMNQCATQIKTGVATTACSPEVAAQAQDIARDTTDITNATKSAANPNGIDDVYWIAPDPGQTKSSDPHVFHLCEAVSPLKDKTVHHGSVTQAYAENAIRITKQIDMEQKQCGFNTAG